ncbi:hypothetical protein RHGRI_004680 [Rhododendron griersonianum]|uniref:Uncharacterized protein n=2 Tax=Rhododendron TaxID=4346 RepID=A0AAV6L9I8_9ERIC|nr:hypothetical protein RHGRI_004680 [Rhododendron griersonianum]
MLPSDGSFSIPQKRQLLLAFRLFKDLILCENKEFVTLEVEIRASVFLGVEEEDRAIEKEEGLPRALFGSCNDRAK